MAQTLDTTRLRQALSEKADALQFASTREEVLLALAEIHDVLDAIRSTEGVGLSEIMNMQGVLQARAGRSWLKRFVVGLGVAR